MKYFCVPADFKSETIDRMCELNSKYNESKVIETYGQATKAEIVNSGRISQTLPLIDLNGLEKYIKYSRDREIDFNYTFNPITLNNKEFTVDGMKEIKTFLNDLYNIGVKRITVTLPSIIEAIKVMGMDFEVVASVMCSIDSLKKAEFYKELGVARIVSEADINRKFGILNSISQLMDGNVEIFINNMCVRNCPLKMFHFNYEANMSGHQKVKDFYFFKCQLQKAKKVENLLRMNWVRPEDLKYYSSIGIKYFKIIDRQIILRGNVVKALECYFNEEYDGNLCELLNIFLPHEDYIPYIDNKKLDGFVKGFLDNEELCQDNCNTCGYCKKYAQKAINVEEVGNYNRDILQYFTEKEGYVKFLKRIGGGIL